MSDTILYIYACGARDDGFHYAVGKQTSGETPDGGLALFKHAKDARLFAYAVQERDGATVAVLPSAEIPGITEEKANTNVWTDGFGTWHASVPLTDNRRANALAARELIRQALKERSGPNFDPRTVHVVRERITGHSTVIYKECLQCRTKERRGATEGANTKVWADAFGVWHASVPLTENGQANAKAARALIREALTEREGPNFDTSSVHVIRERVTGHGTVIYKES